MTVFNVHIYREMRLVYSGIEAGNHAEAAAIARDKPTDAADAIEDCDGETIAALVDVHGDEDYRHSCDIDFDGERLRRAAPKLVAALKGALYTLDENMDGFGPSKPTAIANARTALAEAEAACPPSTPEAWELLPALDYVRATLKLRHIDEASDDEVEEALAIADAAIANEGTAQVAVKRCSKGF